MEKCINEYTNLKKIVIQMLNENSISFDYIGNKIYYGLDSFTIPVMVQDTIYYFKFFVNVDEEYVDAEVKIVEYIRNQGVNTVPKYFRKHNQIIFRSSKFNIIFYGTQSIEFDENPLLDENLIKDIVISIADMHSKIKMFDKKSINLKKISTSDRILTLFIKSNRYNDYKEINRYIEDLALIDIDNERTYPIHADLHIGNIKVYKGKISGIIDFSNIVEASFEYDISKFFQDILMKGMITVEELEYLINLYENRAKIEVNKKSLYVNIVYNILFRYLYSNEKNDEKILFTINKIINNCKK